jgi:hypothetical protein
LDLSQIKEKIDELKPDPICQSWRLQCIPIADKIAKVRALGNFGPVDEFPKFMLGDILPVAVDRVIFLRADTLSSEFKTTVD